MIEVGDTVEYCFEDGVSGYKRYHGSIGTVLEIRKSGSRRISDDYGVKFDYECVVRWESGLLATDKKYKNPSPFWNFTVKKVSPTQYDPAQAGDKDDDI